MGTLAIKRYQKDEVILNEGDRDEHLYKIFSGWVELYIHYGKVNQCKIGTLTASQYFGQGTILSGEPSSYTAVAGADISLLMIPKNNFAEYVKSDPNHAIQIMKSMEWIYQFVYEFAYELSEIDKVDALIAVNRVMDRHKADENVQKAAVLNRKNIQAASVDAETTEKAAEEEELLVPEEEYESTQPDNLVTELRDGKGLRIGVDVLPENIQEVNEIYLSSHKRYPNITHPEYKKFLFKKEYTCPACEKKFMGDHVFYSKLVGEKKPDFARYDLRAFYKDFEAEWYEIVTCPHCYFSTLADIFTESKFEGERYQYGSRLKSGDYQETLVWAYMEMDLDFSVERDLNFVIAQHYMGLVCARGFTEHQKIFAHIWSNLSWLYRSIGDDELAKQAEKNAKECYMDIYTNYRLSQKQEQIVCLNVANILYREEKWHEARRWVMNLWSEREMRNTVYANLGRQLLDDIKEKIEEEKLEQERLEQERLEQEQQEQLEQERLERERLKQESIKIGKEIKNQLAEKSEELFRQADLQPTEVYG